MTNPNIMHADTQSQLGYVTQAPAPTDAAQQACGGTYGCQRFMPADFNGAQMLADFTAAANDDLPRLQAAINNSGKHYLEAEELSKAALDNLNRFAKGD